MFLEIRSVSGRTTQMGHTCAMASTPWQDIPNRFTFQMTTPNIWGGSRVWSTLSMSAGFGQRLASWLNALAPSILRDRSTAVAATSFTLSPISHHRSRCSKNISNRMDICAIFIPNTTANWILLSSTGVQRSFGSTLLAVQGLLMRWKQ